MTRLERWFEQYFIAFVLGVFFTIFFMMGLAQVTPDFEFILTHSHPEEANHHQYVYESLSCDFLRGVENQIIAESLEPAPWVEISDDVQYRSVDSPESQMMLQRERERLGC